MIRLAHGITRASKD